MPSFNFNKNAVKKSKSEEVFNKNKKAKSGILIIAVLLILVNVGYTMYSKQSVDIVRLTNSLPQDGLITESLLVKDTMLREEFKKQGLLKLADGSTKRAIVLWSDKDKIINKYSSYYIRKNTPVYWDSIAKETPKKFSYLYRMSGELIELKAIDVTGFQEILVPGDRINIRVSYTENEFKLPSEQEFMMYQQTGVQMQSSVTKEEKLFSAVPITEMLNSNNESIFNIYYSLLSLPKAKQKELLSDSSFTERLKPVKINLEVTPEEADRYMRIQSKSPNYMISVLPRSQSNPITEVLNTLQIDFTQTTK